MKTEELVSSLLGLCFAVKLFHYRTKYYGAHKTADKFFEKYLETADQFLEVYQGKYGRIKFEGEQAGMTLPVLTDDNIINYLTNESKWIAETLKSSLKSPQDGDLLNICDELQGIIDQFKYLLTFQ